MNTERFDNKSKALALRKKGFSIRRIENDLKISRSTLSGWFRGIKLTEKQQNVLNKNWMNGLVIARKKAVLWHNKAKIDRLEEAENKANEVLDKINLKDNNILELALAMLYLGEGFKKSCITALGNTDPLILKFFVSMLINNYGVEKSKIKCELHLRADQNDSKMRLYWSKKLGLSRANFLSTSVDCRTKGVKTYNDYKGVCVVRCGTVAIQRKLVYISRQFCEKAIQRAVSSVGRALH